MTQPIRLTVIAVSDVRAEQDVFRCAPYRVTLTAHGCLERQVKRDLALPTATPWGQAGARRPGDYEKCRGCADGAAIAAQVKRP